MKQWPVYTMLVNSNIGLVFLDSAKRHNSSLPAAGGAKRPVWMKFTQLLFSFAAVFAFIVYRVGL